MTKSWCDGEKEDEHNNVSTQAHYATTNDEAVQVSVCFVDIMRINGVNLCDAYARERLLSLFMLQWASAIRVYVACVVLAYANIGAINLLMERIKINHSIRSLSNVGRFSSYLLPDICISAGDKGRS